MCNSRLCYTFCTDVIFELLGSQPIRIEYLFHVSFSLILWRLARLTTIVRLVKETLFMPDLQPALNANASSEKLLLY